MDEKTRHLLLKGREHYENREYPQAEKVLTEVLREHRGFADVYNMLGVIYHDQGRFSDAQESFEQAVTINPAYTEAALNLAVTYNELGKYAAAKEVYSQAMVRSKEQPREVDSFARGKLANMHGELALAYVGIGFLEEAITEYEKALGLCPSFVDLRTKLANTLRDAGNLKRAVEEYREVLRTNPSFVIARLQLGVTYYVQKDNDAAVKEWRMALKSEPESKSAMAYLRMVGAEPTE
ncbi:MAG: tetratricopeptide repeat protein [Deltaproteobacteria bacterium]|nr:tetratricopeptide repeat protein [Deltaproteobacteria bacterium]